MSTQEVQDSQSGDKSPHSISDLIDLSPHCKSKNNPGYTTKHSRETITVNRAYTLLTAWLILLLLAGVGGVTSLQAAPPPTPEPGVFPIGCFPGPPADANTLANWQTIKDANFTVVCPLHRYETRDNLTMLQHCQRVGLKAVVNVKIVPPTADDPLPGDWQERVHATVKQYAGHDAFFGYMLKDEPNAAQFGQLGQVSAEFARRDPKHVPFINLFPTYATVEQLGTATYEEHLEQFLTTVKPPVLCYDHYALLIDGRDHLDYFLNLELARQAAGNHDATTWIVILAKWFEHFREPTEDEMRWQVYTSLAYGMKGLFYFAIWPVRDDYVGVVHYDGRPGPLYPVIQQLNSEIRTLGKTLLTLKSTGVYHVGSVIPDGCKGPADGLPVSVTEDLPVVLGFFEGPEQARYAMIVNRDYNRPIRPLLRFASDVRHVRRVSEKTGNAQPVSLEEQSVALELLPGGGVLLRFETGSSRPKP